MSEGRSPDERLGNGAAGTETREPWYERVLHRFGLRSRDSIRMDLEDLLAGTVENPDFSPAERAMLKNVLGFHRIRVQDVMVPRADIVAVAADTTLGELLRLFRTAGHSRLPVYGETLDDPRGMVHIRDFLEYLVVRAESGTRRRRTKTPEVPALGNVDLSVTLATARILRPVLFVPPSMPAVELLVRMQTTRTHMALVIDEYGGTDGLVSIEDLVETVVGDIEDEHDEEAARKIVQIDHDTFVVDARAYLDDVATALETPLATEDMAEDIDTLGGLIVTLAGRVPTRSELIAGPEGLEFEILDADPRRLKRIRIHRRDLSLAGTAVAAPTLGHEGGAALARKAEQPTGEDPARSASGIRGTSVGRSPLEVKGVAAPARDASVEGIGVSPASDGPSDHEVPRASADAPAEGNSSPPNLEEATEPGTAPDDRARSDSGMEPAGISHVFGDDPDATGGHPEIEARRQGAPLDDRRFASAKRSPGRPPP